MRVLGDSALDLGDRLLAGGRILRGEVAASHFWLPSTLGECGDALVSRPGVGFYGSRCFVKLDRQWRRQRLVAAYCRQPLRRLFCDDNL